VPDMKQETAAVTSMEATGTMGAMVIVGAPDTMVIITATALVGATIVVVAAAGETETAATSTVATTAGPSR